MKDRLRTVHQEDRLQDVLVSVAALRKRCAGLKPSNFNSQELRAAVRGVLKMGWCGVRHGGRVAELCRTSVMWLAVVWVWWLGLGIALNPPVKRPVPREIVWILYDENVWGECINELYFILPVLSFYLMLCCILQRILMNETDRSKQGVWVAVAFRLRFCQVKFFSSSNAHNFVTKSAT